MHMTIYLKKVFLSILSIVYAYMSAIIIDPIAEQYSDQLIFYTDIIFYAYAIIGVTVATAHSKEKSLNKWVLAYLAAALICLILIELKKNDVLGDSYYYLITLGASSAAPTLVAVWFGIVALVRQEGSKVVWNAIKIRLTKWISGEFNNGFFNNNTDNFEDYGSE